jgi:hypothetical protein
MATKYQRNNQSFGSRTALILEAGSGENEENAGFKSESIKLKS